MGSRDIVFQNFLDGLCTAAGEGALRAVAERATQQLGFNWFAYLGLGPEGPILISTYDRAWTDRYFEESYDRIDPVVSQARRGQGIFAWDGEAPEVLESRPQRRLFLEAGDFGIKSGITIPIRGAFGRFAALTLSGDARGLVVERMLSQSGDVLQMMALHFHARVDLTMRRESGGPTSNLTQRETECLAWSSRGKTMPEVAEILGVRPRTVAFHLENARLKLGASNVTHAVAICLRNKLLP